VTWWGSGGEANASPALGGGGGRSFPRRAPSFSVQQANPRTEASAFDSLDKVVLESRMSMESAAGARNCTGSFAKRHPTPKWANRWARRVHSFLDRLPPHLGSRSILACLKGGLGLVPCGGRQPTKDCHGPRVSQPRRHSHMRKTNRSRNVLEVVSASVIATFLWLA